MAWRNFDGDTVPFLCPPKFYHNYYGTLIKENTEWAKDEVITDLIFEFVNGELDHKAEYLTTENYQYLQYSLRQRFLLKTAKITLCDAEFDGDDEWFVDPKAVEPNTMDSGLIGHFLEDGFSLHEDMASIWFYSSRKSNNHGLKTNIFTVCGQTKMRSFADGKFKPIWVKIKLRIDGVADENADDVQNGQSDIGKKGDIYALNFTFSDSLELFWCAGLDWDCWKKEDVQRFAP